MSQGWVGALAELVARRTSRRGFLARTAVVGAAVALDPVNYVLRPASAYSTVCGDGASCQSGWTAFCVTVNKGVNACPPGSFVAGWWKADNASVCGGHARYYIDCNASCENGRPGHYSCSCRCAPGHTCDQRHTCCNQFRYGQCNQHIACYGPVVCRVVSCVPPWRWAPCSRSAATDNNTLSHSAPALPHHYDAIEHRYVAMNGAGSPLGASVHGRVAIRNGVLQRYQHGLLAWSRTTPVAMLTATATAYEHLGGPRGELGFPKHDERRTHDGHGRLSVFEHGALYVGGGHAYHASAGAWLHRWVALVDDTSVLGTPRSHVLVTGDAEGRRADFIGGYLLWSAATGAHVVSGAAGDYYASAGLEGCALGYPVADTAPKSYGSMTAFQNGALYVTTAGAFAVLPPVLDVYRSSGAETGGYGLPTGNASVDATGTSQSFEGGTIRVDTVASG